MVLSWELPSPICAGKMLATIIRGKDLKKMDWMGGNDVYCKFKANSVLKRTQTLDDAGATPVWNFGEGESLQFKLRDM